MATSGARQAVRHGLAGRRADPPSFAPCQCSRPGRSPFCSATSRDRPTCSSASGLPGMRTRSRPTASILRSAFLAHDGYEVDTAGDSFFVAFARAADAVAAAGDAQRGLASATWPDGMAVRVRMGVHTGEPVAVASGYVGIDVHRAARIMAAAHGGQVVVSGTTQALLDWLDRHASCATSARIGSRTSSRRSALPARRRRSAGDFPPLRSLHRSNLPVAAMAAAGPRAGARRDRDGSSTAGPGWSRSPAPAARARRGSPSRRPPSSSDAFPDGVFFVPLAALRDVDAVRPAVAEALGLQRRRRPRRLAPLPDGRSSSSTTWSSCGVAARRGAVARRRHGRARDVAVAAAPLRRVRVPVSPLDDARRHRAVREPRGVASGRRVEPDADRASDLPPPRQPAARDSSSPQPGASSSRRPRCCNGSTRCSRGLGAASQTCPERQQTLRATIAWSHDLLDEPARAAFRRLCVFRGSFTLEAAEAIADTDLDAIATLVDQSLVVARPDGRFLLLETIRAFGLEQLAAAGETRDVELRHARLLPARAGGAGPPLPNQPRRRGARLVPDGGGEPADDARSPDPARARRGRSGGLSAGSVPASLGIEPGGASAPRDPADGRPARRRAAGARARSPCDAGRPARRLDGGSGLRTTGRGVDVERARSRHPRRRAWLAGGLLVPGRRPRGRSGLCASERLRRRSTSTGRLYLQARYDLGAALGICRRGR